MIWNQHIVPVRFTAILVCLIGFAFLSPARGQVTLNNWPQLQGNPQRTGYSPFVLNLPIQTRWAYGFAPDRIYPQNQPIIGDGRVFIGTTRGKFFAFKADSQQENGEVLWTFNAKGPILQSAAYAKPDYDLAGRVFFGSMDGIVYALRATTGEELWRYQSHHRAGFSCAILLVGEMLFIGNRAGAVYALSQRDGTLLWKVSVGSPLFASMAYDEIDGGRIFFGAQDMKVHALRASDGSEAWQRPTKGWAYKDYWPMVHQGRVYIRAMKVQETADKLPPGLPLTTETLTAEQQASQVEIIAHYQNNPLLQDLYVFDVSNGEPLVVPHYSSLTMNGATCPPAVDRDGRLVFPVEYAIESGGAGWGRYDPQSNRIVEVLWDGEEALGNGDESMCASSAGNLIFLMHTEEGNAQFTGMWDLDQKKSIDLGAYNAEYFFWNNSQGGGTTPASFANGLIFHTTQNTLNCRTGR